MINTYSQQTAFNSFCPYWVMLKIGNANELSNIIYKGKIYVLNGSTNKRGERTEPPLVV